MRTDCNDSQNKQDIISPNGINLLSFVTETE